MGIQTYAQRRGPLRRDPKTGAVFPSVVAVHEICDSAKDARKYVVVERHGTTGTELRRVEFVSPGYYGTADNLCGKLEDRAARDLAREWSKER